MGERIRACAVWAACVGVAALVVAPAAQATFPGENGKIFFSAIEGGSGSYDIWSTNADGSGLVNLTDLPGGPGNGLDASVSGDGSRVAFTVGSQATSEIWIMNADGSAPQQLTSNTELDIQPGISPDGSQIAFMSTRGSPPGMPGTDRDIWVMNSDGSNPHVLLDHTGEEFYPEFTPDGQTVVMTSEVTSGDDVAYAPLTSDPGATPTPVTSGPATLSEATPSVSPDGTRVAFGRTDEDVPLGERQADVFSIGLDGMNETPIATTPAVNELSPAYSPDGTKILYSNPSGLVMANVDGSSATPLDTGPAMFASQPDWAVVPPPTPDGGAADTDPPETEITKEPKDKVEKPSVKYGFRSDEPGSSFLCKFDKKAFKPCASPRKYKRLDDGRHKFKVQATDPAGNTDPTPDKDKFKVVG